MQCFIAHIATYIKVYYNFMCSLDLPLLLSMDLPMSKTKHMVMAS